MKKTIHIYYCDYCESKLEENAKIIRIAYADSSAYVYDVIDKNAGALESIEIEGIFCDDYCYLQYIKKQLDKILKKENKQLKNKKTNGWLSLFGVKK